MGFYQPVPSRIDDSEDELFKEAKSLPMLALSDPKAASLQTYDTAPIANAPMATAGAQAAGGYTSAGIMAAGGLLAGLGKAWMESDQRKRQNNVEALQNKNAMDLHAINNTSMASHNALTGLINAYRSVLRKG